MVGARVRMVVLIAGLGLAMSACTGTAAEPDSPASSSAEPTPTASVSSSPSASAPVKPKRPAAMKRDDAKGAAAAAKYFIELYPYVMATGDVEEFKAMSHRACGFCDDALEQAKKIVDNGYVYSGGESSLVVTKVYARDGVTGIFPLDAEIEQDASLISGADGREIFSANSKVSDSRVEMGSRNGRWVVVTIAPRPGV